MLRALIIIMLGSVAHASKPVKHTTSGCVVGGAYYGVDDDHAYRYAVMKLDLEPFEGKAIKMTGWLSPGDRFELLKDGKVIVLAQTCGAAMLTPIKRIGVMDLRLAAGRAVDAGDFEKAVQLANQAVAAVTPADCDTHIDRATVYAQKGDLASARADLAIIKARQKCRLVKGAQLNFLLLQDLAAAFVAKADKPSAVTALELAKTACTIDACKADIAKALDEAKKP